MFSAMQRQVRGDVADNLELHQKLQQQDSKLEALQKQLAASNEALAEAQQEKKRCASVLLANYSSGSWLTAAVAGLGQLGPRKRQLLRWVDDL